MSKLRLGCLCVLSLIAVENARAQNPCGYAFSVSGQKLYQDYCTSCHGVSGKGDGPSATRFKQPADLTQIKQLNKGQFPAGRVATIIRFGGGIPAHDHGSMTWGEIFNTKCGPAFSRRAVVALKSYVESLQQ